MSDISIEKQENNISFRFDYTSCWSCVHKHCTRIWCILGVCLGCAMIDSLTLTVLSPCVGMCMHSAVDVAWFSASWMRLCIAKLHVAGSHRYFLTTSESKIKWHVWLIHPGLVGVQYIKVLKEYIFVYSFPSLLLGFIFSSLSILNLEVRPEIKVITLALAFFFCI